jgi:hypothetical protein
MRRFCFYSVFLFFILVLCTPRDLVAGMHIPMPGTWSRTIISDLVVEVKLLGKLDIKGKAVGGGGTTVEAIQMLKGKKWAKQERFDVALPQYSIDKSGFFQQQNEELKKGSYKIKNAILFFYKRKDSYQCSDSRYLTEAGVFLTPTDLFGFGTYSMRPAERNVTTEIKKGEKVALQDFAWPKKEGIKWSEEIDLIKTCVEKMTGLRGIGKIADKRQRSRRALSWIRNHKDELGDGVGLGNLYRNDETWGSLGNGDVFEWVFEEGDLQNSWQALSLYTEIEARDGFEEDGGHYYCRLEGVETFCATREARNFLMDIALSNNKSVHERALALYRLNEDYWEEDNVSEREQIETIDQTIPLLASSNALFKRMATEMLVEVSSGNDNMATVRALPALKDLYLNEAPGQLRSYLASKIYQMMSLEDWFELTGNEHNMYVALDMYSDAGALHFRCINAGTDNALVRQAPVLLIESLDPGVKVSKSILYQLSPESGSWSKGWSSRHADLIFDLANEKLPYGKWKARVSGTSMKNGFEGPWSTETIIFTHLELVESNESIYQDFFVLPEDKSSDEFLTFSSENPALRSGFKTSVRVQKNPKNSLRTQAPGLIVDQEADNSSTLIYLLCLAVTLGMLGFHWRKRFI